MKKLNKTGPSTEPWGTPLVTGLQLDSVPLSIRGNNPDAEDQWGCCVLGANECVFRYPCILW